MVDRLGVIYTGRIGVVGTKTEFAQETEARSGCAIGADVCIGLAGPDLITQEMLKTMANKPILFACSNPDPEISPLLANC